MKLGSSLYVQTLSMLVLYLTTLLAIIFFCFNAQFGVGWEALINSPLGDRVDTIADAINSQLANSSSKHWNDVLRNFGKIYGVDFYVFDIFGNELAGDSVTLPNALSTRASGFPPPPQMGPMDPPPGDFPPPPPPPHSGDFVDHRFMIMDGPHDARRKFTIGHGSEFGAFPFHKHMFPPFPASAMHAHGRLILHTENPSRFWICTNVLITGQDFDHPIPGRIVASSNNLWQSSVLFDFHFVALVLAVLLLLSLIFWMPFVYSITSSLSQLTSATEGIALGRFDTRLKVKRQDEIGRLSDAVNRMAERLNSFVTGQKRFLGDISHELFSPIARLQIALELLSEASTSEQESLITDIREEVQEMTALVNELLAYSKAGMQGKSAEIVEINLRSLLDESIPHLGLTEKVVLNVPEGISVLSDRILLERALSNILRNSARYAGDAGAITVDATLLGTTVSIAIADNGPGVPEEALKHLGEPFFRPEASRNRSSGGFGLGLAIVKTCIEACGGSVSLRNRKTGGLEVEIKLKSGLAIQDK